MLLLQEQMSSAWNVEILQVLYGWITHLGLCDMEKIIVGGGMLNHSIW